MLTKLSAALAVTIVSFLAVQEASAQVSVRGYYRSNGTYVQPHYRSNPDRSFYNNWSTYPNINPYTGKIGTKLTPSYGSTRSNGGYKNYGSSYRYPSYSSSYRSYFKR